MRNQKESGNTPIIYLILVTKLVVFIAQASALTFTKIASQDHFNFSNLSFGIFWLRGYLFIISSFLLLSVLLLR